MHVVMVSDIEARGGAAIAASRLAGSLLDRGIKVTRVVGEKSAVNQRWETRTILPTNAAFRATRRLMPGALWEGASRSFATGRLKLVLRALSPDVINVHNLHWAANDGWSPSLAAACSKVAPTVWTLHDMWSFTGGCVYAFDCDRFRTACGRSCLDHDGHERLDEQRITKNWALAKKVLEQNPSIAAVSPSMWLAGEAKKGLWRGHRVEVIRNPLDLDVYRPIDRTLARSRLGLQSEQQVVLVAGHNLTISRKGMDILQPALKACRTLATVALMGRWEQPMDLAGMTVKHLGSIQDDHRKVLAYSAADVVLQASKAENLSNVIVESLACGTPTVGFAVGGNPELIRPERSGWLSPEVSVEGLSGALRNALSDIGAGADLRKTSRAVAEEVCDSDSVTTQYVALFESLAQ